MCNATGGRGHTNFNQVDLLSIPYTVALCQGALNVFFPKELLPKPKARSAVPGVSPGRGLLIPHGNLALVTRLSARLFTPG